MKKTKRDQIVGYLFSFPSLCLYVGLIVVPFLYGFYISMCEWNGFTAPQFIGFKNYMELFADEEIFKALNHNALYAVGTVSVKLILGFLVAMLLNKKIKGITFFRTTMFAPVIISFVAIGTLWKWMFNPTMGLLNTLLSNLGLMDIQHPVTWLGDGDLALLCLMIVDVWKWLGYHVVLFLAGLQMIPTELYDSARVDGASRWQVLRFITLPQMKSVFYMNLTFCLNGAFNVFDIVMVMTNGGPFKKTEVIAKYIYDMSFGATNRFGYASSISIFLFIMLLIVTMVILRLMRRAEEAA